MRGSDRWRGSLTIALLIVSLVTTALLAAQAQITFLYHRSTAEKVLRDFARLAATEFVRRATARLGYDGYAVLLTAAGRRLGPRGLPPDFKSELAAHADARVREASRLARGFFVASPRSGKLVLAPGLRSDDLEPWLLEKLASRAESVEGFAVVHGVIGGVPRSFVVTGARGAGEWQMVGFEAELAQLGTWLDATLGRGPLLPSFVGTGNVTNDSLRVTLRDHGGVVRLRKGPEAAGVAVEMPFGSAYSGVLDGSRVEVGIEPAAARRLVIGGVPQSRVGVVLALLGLSTGLVVVALLQLRRQRALQRMREEFIASVSHELRTPLTQIRMFAETLLLDRVRSDQERRRSLEIIDREARRLTHLVENVLQFSRGERGTLAVARELRPLAPLVRELLEQFQPLAAGSGARIVAKLDDSAAASVDADALRQILLNLLDNAVKYGPREQQLSVALERAEGVVRLSVEDQGPGIPASARKRIFERYERLPRDQASAVAGTGIGLAVVADLVGRHGGRAFVEDGAKGGARFVVELPA